MNLSPGILFAALCVLVPITALFSTLIVALRTLSRSKLLDIAERDEGTPRSRRLRAIADDPGAHAAALSVPRILVNLVVALACVLWISALMGRNDATPGALAGGLLLATGVLWVFHSMIPAAVSDHAGEHAVALFALPVRALYTVAYPLRLAGRFIDEVVRRLAGSSNGASNEEINAEILSIVSEGQREGHLDETDREMLEAVVEFRSTLVESVMTPRTEIDALESTDDIAEVNAFLDEHGHSRVPVYEENLDHIVGILYAKDVLRWLTNHDPSSEPFSLRPILREPTFVPETKTVRELLAELLAKKVHIAMIIDEYGGTSGLVTIEDIVEEIFGEIQDEYEDPEDQPGGVTLDEQGTRAEIDARTEIDDANDELERLGIEIPESDDYDTVAGFVNTALGRIPDPGETVDLGAIRVEILEAEPTRVLRVRVEPIRGEHDTQPEPASESA